MKEYKTIRHSGKDEFTEKRSRFIGYCKPVGTAQEAIAFINEIKSKHWDAKHNVYAYVLSDGQTMRCSDDGEPQGTAGVPVLDVIKKSGVTDAAVVVTRYFGGVLLGTGGLVRAYSHAAGIALAAGEPVTMRLCSECCVRCTYSQYGRVCAVAAECGGVIDGSVYGTRVEILFHIPSGLLGTLGARLAAATGGEVTVQANGERYYPAANY